MVYCTKNSRVVVPKVESVDLLGSMCQSQQKPSLEKFINLCNSLNFFKLFDIVSASTVETINSC